METIPLRADDKGTEAGSTGQGASHKELLAPVGLETPPPGRPPARARALGSRAGRGPQQLFVLAGGLQWTVVQRAFLYWCQGRRVCF